MKELRVISTRFRLENGLMKEVRKRTLIEERRRVKARVMHKGRRNSRTIRITLLFKCSLRTGNDRIDRRSLYRDIHKKTVVSEYRPPPQEPVSMDKSASVSSR